MGWTLIPFERAKTHPLYGISGWLRWLTIMQVLMIARNILFHLRNIIFSPHPEWGPFVIAIIFTALQIPMLYLLFKRARNYRIVAIITVSICAFLSLLLNLIVMLTTSTHLDARVMVGILSGLADWIFWAIYLQRSRRVRVTFEHAVRENDLLAQSEQTEAYATVSSRAISPAS